MSGVEIGDDDWDVVVSKMISGGTLFVVSVICGVIPFKLAKIFKWTEPLDKHDGSDKKSNTTVEILLSFGGGVLLATTFLHLLPEINYTIKWLTEDGLLPHFQFNLGELLMMIGFFLIYLIEELVHNYLHRYQEKMKKENERKSDTNSVVELGGAFMRGIDARNSAIMKGFPANQEKSQDAENQESQVQKAHDQGHGHGHGHSHLPIAGGEDDALVSSLRGLLIVLALSIHELFEGFAVGLEKTTSSVYFMFAAVSAHKFVIAFCIGVELIVQRTKLWLAFVYVVIYSVVSAIGIAVGAVLTSGSNGDNLQVLNIILQGLATGTLLYVIFFEVLSKGKSGLLSYLAVAGGFLLMFGLQYIAGVTESQAGIGTKGIHLHHHHH